MSFNTSGFCFDKYNKYLINRNDFYIFLDCRLDSNFLIVIACVGSGVCVGVA